MTTKKKIILFASIAGCAVLIGVIAALIFSSMGTGNTFRGGASCAGKPSADAELTEPDDSDILIVATDEADSEEYGSTQTNTTPHPDATPTPVPTPTTDPYEELLKEADKTMMKDIVNILLVGIDYSTERETWTFKDFHSDVMIVLAINFEENRADLISLPRDTYAKIPGVKGIYKLNAALNCGGNLYTDDGKFNPKGLEKVCEAAEWMLGGIPVEYYYAVTMKSLKELVDLCGGLEYDMDIKFHIQGRSYEKGLQHINGQAFLDYCRVRKSENGLTAAETNDSRRVDRQKRMLIAMFKQMKADRLITKIPEIVSTFNGELFTNCTLAQTTSLAAFAYNLDPNNIAMYSMSGTMTSLFQWNFCFTDQANRVDIINKVYHQKVSQYPQYTLKYGRYRWCDMLYDHYKELLDPLTKYVQKLIDEDDKLPEFTDAPATKTPAPSDPTPAPTKKPTAPPSDPPTAPPTTPSTKPPTEPPTEPPTDPPTDPPTAPPTDPPTDPPTAPPTDPPIEPITPPTGDPSGDSNEGGPGTDASTATRGFVLTVKAGTGETRKISLEDRALFEQYKTCVQELEKLHTEADKEAKKARNGKSNSLGNVGQEYLVKLAEVQDLAIKVAKTFSYTKVKNFTTPFAPTACYGGNSPWAINYFYKKSFNEVIVDFN